MRVKTPRLYLRRFAPGDGDALYTWLGDAEVVRYEPYGAFTLAQCRREATLRAKSEVYWAIQRRDTGALIGNISLVKREYGSWELGYILAAAHHGQGFATEAARAMVDRAFTVWQAHRVSALCNPENAPSLRVLERLGMRREGHLKQNVYFDVDAIGHPLWQDTYLYAVLRSEWAPNNQPQP